MRLIILLIALLLVGLLIRTQLNRNTATENPTLSNTEQSTIKAPTRPQDMQQFSQEVDQLLQHNAEQQRADIERLEQ